MKKFNIKYFLASLVCGVMLLQGCSSIGKTYMEINPEDAAHQMKTANGYYALQKFKNENDGTRSLIVFRSPQFYFAQYYLCESEKCLDSQNREQYQDIGSVSDSSDGYVLPWVSKMVRAVSFGRSKNFIEKLVEPGKLLKIKARGNSYDRFFKVLRTCGPVYEEINPQAGRAYVVHYQVGNSSCHISVYDATDPDHLVKLP